MSHVFRYLLALQTFESIGGDFADFKVFQKISRDLQGIDLLHDDDNDII